MPGIKLSEQDRLAVIYKKLISANVSDPGYVFVEQLSPIYREVVYTVLREGTDREKRKYRLEMELIRLGLIDLRDRVERADPSISLEDAEVNDNWQFFTLEEAYQPLEPLEWIVQGMIARPSVNIFYGAPKSLKTLLLQDLCSCVASGKPWLESLPENGQGQLEAGIKTTQTPVMWLDFENGARRMKERFSAFGRARKLPNETPIFCTSMPSPWLDAGQADHIGRLMLRLETYGAGLLVIDHLTQIVGDIDENTSGMAEIMGHLRGMAEAANLALVLIHHQIKNSGRFGVSASDSLRGHGSILASCDLALVVERNIALKDQINLLPAAVRGANVDPISALFTYEHKPGNSLELETARFWGTPVETLNAKIDKTILEVVEENPGLNQSQLRSQALDLLKPAGIGDPAIRYAIARLVKSGSLIESTEKNKKIYDLPL